MVVVAVAMAPARPFRRVCSNMGCGVEVAGDGIDVEGLASSFAFECVLGVEADVGSDGWVESRGLSRLVRGVPVVMIVFMD